jgi:hypothetical protein
VWPEDAFGPSELPDGSSRDEGRALRMLDPGLERANLRALLGVRCLAAAAQDLDYVCREGERDADELIGAQVFLQTYCRT